jgi:hypothetical protein
VVGRLERTPAEDASDTISSHPPQLPLVVIVLGVNLCFHSTRMPVVPLLRSSDASSRPESRPLRRGDAGAAVARNQMMVVKEPLRLS